MQYVCAEMLHSYSLVIYPTFRELGNASRLLFIYGSPRWFGALFFDLRFVSRRSPILLAPTIAREGFVFRFKGFLRISNSSPFSGRAHEVSSSGGRAAG